MDKFPQAFKRFEEEMDISKVKDTDDIYRKYVRWQGYKISTKQQICIRRIAIERGIIIIKPKGISERKGKPREELRKRYTTHKVRGKVKMVARIPKGKKGAGRFTHKRNI